MRLSKIQQDFLLMVDAQCRAPACTGACDLGWYEPIEGGELLTARSLAKDEKGLVSTANGSRSHWVAAHVTLVGRALASKIRRRQARLEART